MRKSRRKGIHKAIKVINLNKAYTANDNHFHSRRGNWSPRATRPADKKIASFLDEDLISDIKEELVSDDTLFTQYRDIIYLFMEDLNEYSYNKREQREIQQQVKFLQEELDTYSLNLNEVDKFFSK